MAPRKPPRKGKIAAFRRPSAKPAKEAPTTCQTCGQVLAIDRNRSIPQESEIPSWEAHGVRVEDLPVPRRPGPPGEFTQRVVDIILYALRIGATRKAAAAAAGIHYETLYTWLREGRAGDPQYEAFAKAADFRVADLNTAVSSSMYAEAIGGNVQAGAFILERRDPDNWGQKHVLEVRVKSEFESFFEYMHASISPGAYQEVLTAASNWGAPPPALPPATVTDVQDVPQPAD